MSYFVDITVEDADFKAAMALLGFRTSPAGIAGFLYTAIDPYVRMRASQRFAGEGDDVTGNWHPLTRATELMRAQKGFPPSHPINVRSGKMRHHIVDIPGDVKPNPIGAVLQHPRPGDPLTMLKIETAQRGKSRPRTPARPVLGYNENDMLFITSTLAAWLIS